MEDLDKIIYDAITADTDLMQATGGRVVSTCFEVSPTEQDNTPLPYIIVIDAGSANDNGNKDFVWESDEDYATVRIEIGAASPADVTTLRKQVRQAVERHIVEMFDNNPHSVPTLAPGYPKDDGKAWDWTKPCYYTNLTYQCIINNQ